MSDRYREDVGGRTRDDWDAHVGTPVLSSDEERLGTVAGVEGKYIQVQPSRGDAFWLSVATVRRASEDGVWIDFEHDALPGIALTDHDQVEAGLDAPDPRMQERLDARATETGKVMRREGLVSGAEDRDHSA